MMGNALVVNLIAELEDALDIDIDAAYVVEDNFKTKEAIIAMIEMIIQKRVISWKNAEMTWDDKS